MKKIASICKNVRKKAELTFKRGYFSKNMLSLQLIKQEFAETYTIKSKSLLTEK